MEEEALFDAAAVHAQKDMHRTVENDDDLTVGHDQAIEVKNARTTTVEDADETLTVEKGKRTVTVAEGDDTHTVIKGSSLVAIGTGSDTLTVDEGNRVVEVGTGNDTLTVKAGNHEIKVSAGASKTEAMQSITLKCGQSQTTLAPDGIKIAGLKVSIEGTRRGGTRSSGSSPGAPSSDSAGAFSRAWRRWSGPSPSTRPNTTTTRGRSSGPPMRTRSSIAPRRFANGLPTRAPVRDGPPRIVAR